MFGKRVDGKDPKKPGRSITPTKLAFTTTSATPKTPNKEVKSRIDSGLKIAKSPQAAEKTPAKPPSRQGSTTKQLDRGNSLSPSADVSKKGASSSKIPDYVSEPLILGRAETNSRRSNRPRSETERPQQAEDLPRGCHEPLRNENRPSTAALLLGSEVQGK